MTTINVLYQSDDRYATYMGVSITSLLINNSHADEINFYIIDDEISETNRNKIEKIVMLYKRKIQWIKSSDIKTLDEYSLWPQYKSFRKNTNCILKYYFINSIVDEKIERIMYIDSDSLVTGSLSDLFDISMDGKTMGMTRCCMVSKQYLDAINYPNNAHYYNAGMNLFDIKKWRKNNCLNKMIESANKRMYSTVDQDVLNIVMHDDVFDLGPKYNYQFTHDAFPQPLYSKYYKGHNYYSYDIIADAEKDHKILHFMRFCGEYPWNLKTTHPDKAIYEHYRASSPWANDPEYLSNNNTTTHKIERIMYRALPKSLFIILFKRFHDKMMIDSNNKVVNAR